MSRRKNSGPQTEETGGKMRCINETKCHLLQKCNNKAPEYGTMITEPRKMEDAERQDKLLEIRVLRHGKRKCTPRWGSNIWGTGHPRNPRKPEWKAWHKNCLLFRTDDLAEKSLYQIRNNEKDPGLSRADQEVST